MSSIKKNSKRNSKRNSKKFSSDDDFEVEVMSIINEDDDIPNTTEGMTMRYVDSETISTPAKWSRVDEKTVNKYIMKSIGYKTLYNDTYFRYSLYHNLIKIPLIILTAISLATQIIFATLIQGNSVAGREGILSIVTASISAGVAVLTYFHSTAEYGTMANGSRDASVAFSEFADELRTLLSFPRKIRANPYQVINSIQSDYKKLLKFYSKYPIPTSIFYSFAKNTNNKHIIMDIVDNTEADQFDLHDGLLEKNIITDKFIDSLRAMRNTIPESLQTERRSKLNPDIASTPGSSKTNLSGGIISSENSQSTPKSEQSKYQKLISSFSPHGKKKETPSLKTSGLIPVGETSTPPKLVPVGESPTVPSPESDNATTSIKKIPTKITLNLDEVIIDI